jgi:hypothetical protein
MVKHTMQRPIKYRTIFVKENSTKSKLNKNYSEVGSKFLGIVGNPLMTSGGFLEGDFVKFKPKVRLFIYLFILFILLLSNFE